MGARAEVLPWERQPREGEEAYAAFLAYRDLGPRRTHEATRMRLGKRPGYLKPIERWSALRRLAAAGVRLGRPPASRARQGRRGGGGEVGAAPPPGAGGGLAALPGAAGQAGADARHRPRRRRPSPRPSRPEATPEAIPDAVATPEEARQTAGRGPSRWNDLTVARLSKLVVELEWALLNEALPPPGKIDPLTATDEEIKAYLVLHPRFGRPPPR